MSSATSKIVCLQSLLILFGVPQSGATPLHADNTSAIYIAFDLVFHDRTKHIEVDCHYIRKYVISDDISLPCLFQWIFSQKL